MLRRLGDFNSDSSNFQIPTSIFWDRKVAVLEAISEYLKERYELSYHEIAVLLNRDDRTIWTCFHRAKNKRKERTDNISEMHIPVEVLKDRSVSILEKIVEYLKDEKKLTYHEIAVLLNRDDRTVWTCYNRVSKKRKSAKGVVLNE